MDIILKDPIFRDQLLPLTYTRPVADIRIGILKIAKKWAKYLDATTVSFETQDYLAAKFPKSATAQLVIAGNVLPNRALAQEIKQLKPNETLFSDGVKIAEWVQQPTEMQQIESAAEVTQIRNLWDIFTLNEAEITKDFELLTAGRTSAPLGQGNQIIGDPKRLFLEAGAKVNASILNTETGVIYVGKDAEIMEGCLVRGALAMNEGAVLKMGAKIYGATTLGKFVKIGGEVNNSVIFDYSNKGHEGFLGNSVLGEWCNLGADTNNSNLKNNYQSVKLWDYSTGRFAVTGLQFCGLIMGDHSKAGINTMFNTGTVVGVAANVFGADYPRNFIPSFTWGGTGRNKTFRLPQVFEMADAMMSRRKIPFTEADKQLLQHIFELSAAYRTWDKSSE